MKIQVKNIWFSYDSINALEGISFEVSDKEIISLAGPNGSGKTTLLKCINRILKPKSGNILIYEKDSCEFQLKDLAQILGYAPQISDHRFSFTVFDTVLLGRRPYINWRLTKRDRKIVIDTLCSLNLEGLMLREFNELSGGEQQKVIIARALAQEPEVLLIDEPTSNLDLKHQIEVLKLIRSIVRKNALSIIMAIHDLNLASRFSDKIILLKQGKIYAAGEPRSVFTKEIIKDVYGIEVEINYNFGVPHIILLE